MGRDFINFIFFFALLVSIFTLLLLYFQVRDATRAQIVNNLISLNQQVYPCPRINEILDDMVLGNKLFDYNGGGYSQTEIDNFLGYFEMLGIIEERGYLDLGTINDMFGYDVIKIFENQELVNYIKSDKQATWPFLNGLRGKILKFDLASKSKRAVFSQPLE
jgi:hypothetical protein